MTVMAPCPHSCSRLKGESKFVQTRVPAAVRKRVHERVLNRVRAPMQLRDMARCLRMALERIAKRQNVPKEMAPKYQKFDAGLPFSPLELCGSALT